MLSTQCHSTGNQYLFSNLYSMILFLIFLYIIILDSFIQCYIPRNGSLLTTTSKDKKLRVIDPRSTECLRKGDSHYGTKASKVTIKEFLIVTNSI